jgi:chemotaxis protein MotB
MSKKKHPEHVNHERWLVSYADFITLLFAFFVVLFASSQSDKKKQAQMAEAMQSAFSPNAIFEPHSKQPPLIQAAGNPINAAPSPLQLPIPPAEDIVQTQLHLDHMLAQQVAAHRIPPGSVTMHISPDGLVISLHEAGFFASGSAQIRDASLPMLTVLAASLPSGTIRVEGHTDNIPIHNAQFPTNWELSTARASAIARFLLDQGHVEPAKLSAAGYAEFHPTTSNSTAEGRAQNRRVDIILLEQHSRALSHPSPSR